MIRRITIKKIACIVLAILFLISVSNMRSYSYADDSINYELNTQPRTDELFKENSFKANDAYVRLIQHFYNSEENVFSEKYGKYSVSGIYGAGFPEYYCGAYINTDGNLVVEINKNLKKNAIREAQDDIIGITNGYVPIFRLSDIPYRDLVLTMSEITDLREGTDDPDIELICTYAVDEYNGQIKIGIEKESETTETKVLDSLTYPDIVTFYIVDETPQPCIGNGSYGQPISYDSVVSNDYFSIGYRARYTRNGSPVYGFITCGHGFHDYTGIDTYYASNVFGVNNNAIIYGALIGYIDPYRNVCTLGANIDATFVELSQYSSVTNQIVTHYGGTYTISTNAPANPAIGSTVYSYGASTDDQYGYLQSGYIVSSSTTFYYTYYDANNNPVFTFSVLDTILTTCCIIPGDSGGPSIYESSSGTYTICGINTGIYAAGLNQYSYHTKGTNITAQFGLSPY